MKKKREFQHFLDGGKFPFDYKSLEESESDFVEAYNDMVRHSNNESIPDFDAFEKVNVQNSRLRIKRLISYAAVLVLLLSVPVLIHFLNKKSENPKYTEAQIIEARKNTAIALSYFSQEWNRSLANFNKVNLSSPKKEFKNLNDISIKIDNPFKNLKLEKS